MKAILIKIFLIILVVYGKVTPGPLQREEGRGRAASVVEVSVCLVTKRKRIEQGTTIRSY